MIKLKHNSNLSRAALTLLALIMTCAAAWAETVETYYIDENGTRHNVTATVLTGNEQPDSWDYIKLHTGWYVVNSNISYTNCISNEYESGALNIILADGAEMSISVNYGYAIYTDNIYHDNPLAIYGQSAGTGKLTATSDYQTFRVKGGLTINGGIVSATTTANNRSAIWGDDCDITINGGQVTANGGISCSTLTLGLRNSTDFIHASNYYGTVNIKEGQALYFGTTAYTGNNVSIPDNATLRPNPTNFTDNIDGTYTIWNATGWGEFCDALQDNDTYNRFSGKTVKLGDDISVSRMAGSSSHDFCGTFDGQGNTITVSLSSSGENTALFSYISNTKANPNDANNSPAAIRNLKVTGTVNVNEDATHKYAGGLVGSCWGVLNIENCRVSTVIDSHINGDGTHGGFVGRQANGTLTITGCVFDGSLLTDNGTIKCGGFVGWKGGTTVNINNSLFAPAEVNIGVGTGDIPSATFGRNVNSDHITNSYYTDTLGTAQGTQVYSISKGEYVTTLEINGDATQSYDVSGLDFYSTGLSLTRPLSGGEEEVVLYAVQGDVVSLTLDYTLPEGYLFFKFYTEPSGDLSSNGNPYTLIMPDENVTIHVDYVESFCDPEDMCNLTFELSDSWGDGWNGAAIQVVKEGIEALIGTVTLESGNFGIVTLAVCNHLPIKFKWLSGEDGGIYDNQTSYTVKDAGGNVIYSGRAAQIQYFFNDYDMDCSCAAPSEPTATNITATTATLNWNGFQEN